MTFIAVIAALVALVWAAVLVRHGPVLLGCAVFLVVGYVFGHDFIHFQAGPIPLTLDRVLIVGLVIAMVWQWKARSLEIKPLVATDWLFLALACVLTASALMNPRPPGTPDGGSPMWRLIASYWMPLTLYWIAKQTELTRLQIRAFTMAIGCLGVYLAATAIAEVTQQWWAVFPRYIADPDLGTHFGRARGPMLMAASMGVYLTIGGLALWYRVADSARWAWLGLFALIPLFAAAIFFTYTRSAWLGVAGAVLIVLALELRGRWRQCVLGAVIAVGLFGIAAKWDSIMGLQRETSASDTRHSVQQRASFTYVSWKMFQDRPILGCGFGRFFDQKLPYLSDRSQKFELESIRGLQHHNTFLALLTETGIVGFLLFIAVLASIVQSGWRLVRAETAPDWVRRFGVLTLAVTATYVGSAIFHDLSLSPTEHWALFLFAGIASGLMPMTMPATQLAQPTHRRSPLHSAPTEAIAAIATVTEKPLMSKKQIELFGMKIDRLDMRTAVDRLLGWSRSPRNGRCRYVVTPNVDHAVMYQRRADLRAAYGGADLVLADGLPIVAVARLFGRGLPERVAGSDLVPALFNAAEGPPLRVFLLGAMLGVANQAANAVERQWPGVHVVGTCSPPLGFEKDESRNASILAAIADVKPDVLVVGLGAPKQELWVHAHADQLQAKVALCVGATIDFLAGQRSRSPVWMRRVGLEWLHRVLSEPRRLLKRYTHDAVVFPQLIWREWRASV